MTEGHCLSQGHCLSCLWQDKTNTTQNFPLIAQRPQNSFCANLVFGQFSKPGHFFKSPRCKIGAPRRIFTYLPEKYLGATGCVTEGCESHLTVVESINEARDILKWSVF